LANQGYFQSRTTQLTADNLNGMLMQKDAEANKPAAAQEGRDFWDETNGEYERDNGTSWDVLIESDAIAGTPSLRTLGTGSTQAAAGDHIH
jgi:hypothetical protein